MKNKGFTLVELITTFALFIVVLTVVINIVLSIKNIYYNYDYKTRLLINQGNMLQEFNKKFYYDNLISYNPVEGSTNRYEFIFVDSGTITLEVTDSSIKFGNYIYKFDDGTIYNDDLSVEEITVDGLSAFLVIKIPLTNNLYKNQDFGLNLIYRY